MEKTVKRVIMPILVLVMIAAAFMGAFAFTNTASAETSVAITASNTTVVGGATISSFKPEGEGIPTDGYGLYKEAGLGLKFDFPEKLDVSSFTGNDINKYVFEYWFWADGIPTNGFRIQYNGDSAFSMVDSGNLAGQSDIFNDYTPKTWQKVIITARGCFGGGAYEGKIHGINFEGGNFGSLNAYIYNPVIRLKTDSDSVVGFVGFVETKQVAPSEVTISEGTVVEGVRTLNKYFVDGAPDFTLTAAADNLATNNAVTWSSANDEIATVTEGGTVHLVSAGEVVLTASAVAAPAVKSEIKLVIATATNPVTAVTINDDASVPAEMGGSKKYTADLTTASGEDPDDTTVVWSVTNGTGSATVAGDGTVTFVSAGTVTLRATSFNGVYTEEEITIVIPAAKYMNMDLSAAHGSISTGSLSDVIPVLEGEDLPTTSINPGRFMNEPNWSWFDSSVDCTALLGTKKAVYEVYVYFESDYSGSWQLSIFEGTSEQLKLNSNNDMSFFQSVSNQGYKAGWNKVTIAIDNSKVTSNYLAFGAVDHTGGMPQIYFYGARVYYSASVYDTLGAGKMRIEAMNITAPTGVSISGLSNVDVATGEVTLTAAVTPSHASQEVTWSIVSGNASVDQTGKVTFTEAGSVEVKAESKANPAISATHRITIL